MILDCDNSFENNNNSTEKNSEKRFEEYGIKEADYFNNKFIISNNNEPEKKFDDYDSYKEEYINNKNTNKTCNDYYCGIINNILYKCKGCKKLFCKECTCEHEMSFKHEDFEKTEIMNEDEKQKYDNIIEDIQKTLEKVENIKNNVINHCNKCLNGFIHYLEDYKAIIQNMTLYNFEIFNKKFSTINNNIEQINQTIEKFFTNLYEEIGKNKYITLTNEQSQKFKKVEHSNQESDSEDDTIDSNNDKEIKKVVDINNVEIKCFSPFKNNTYMLTGTKNGEILIYDLPDKKSYNIKNFFGQEEVEYVFELGNNYFVASDGKKQIKIIEFKEKALNLKEIQTININERIFSMIFLSKFSQKKNSLYFCISKEKKIEVYQSNINENNQPSGFERLNKSIELNMNAQSTMEVNEKYLVAGCPDEETVIFFDMENNFKEDKTIGDIRLTSGKNIFSVVYKNRFLNVACNDGFKLIYIKERKLYKSVHCRYSTLCVETLNEDSFICCCYDQNQNKIKKYKIAKERENESRYSFEKICDIVNNNDDEIWGFKKLNDVVYYIDGQNKLNGRIAITC